MHQLSCGGARAQWLLLTVRAWVGELGAAPGALNMVVMGMITGYDGDS